MTGSKWESDWHQKKREVISLFSKRDSSQQDERWWGNNKWRMKKRESRGGKRLESRFTGSSLFRRLHQEREKTSARCLFLSFFFCFFSILLYLQKKFGKECQPDLVPSSSSLLTALLLWFSSDSFSCFQREVCERLPSLLYPSSCLVLCDQTRIPSWSLSVLSEKKCLLPNDDPMEDSWISKQLILLYILTLTGKEQVLCLTHFHQFCNPSFPLETQSVVKEMFSWHSSQLLAKEKSVLSVFLSRERQTPSPSVGRNEWMSVTFPSLHFSCFTFGLLLVRREKLSRMSLQDNILLQKTAWFSTARCIHWRTGIRSRPEVESPRVKEHEAQGRVWRVTGGKRERFIERERDG